MAATKRSFSTSSAASSITLNRMQRASGCKRVARLQATPAQRRWANGAYGRIVGAMCFCRLTTRQSVALLHGPAAGMDPGARVIRQRFVQHREVGVRSALAVADVDSLMQPLVQLPEEVLRAVGRRKPQRNDVPRTGLQPLPAELHDLLRARLARRKVGAPLAQEGAVEVDDLRSNKRHRTAGFRRRPEVARVQHAHQLRLEVKHHRPGAVVGRQGPDVQLVRFAAIARHHPLRHDLQQRQLPHGIGYQRETVAYQHRRHRAHVQRTGQRGRIRQPAHMIGVAVRQEEQRGPATALVVEAIDGDAGQLGNKAGECAH
uniref:Uncharacterized protein n=1 Tax=Anopheles dirus TaxID=7168 RepID=A0A182N058_9DIPT